MDRFSLIELPDYAAPAEQITTASAGNGAWGASTFHNLTEGARASGDVTSAHSLLAAADLAWDPEFRALVTIEGYPVPDVRAVVRSDNSQPIGVVGSRYTLIPHRKLADLADAIVGASGALRYGNAGHKERGARPFLQLKSEPRTLGKDVRGCNVDVSDVITLMTSHDGTMHALSCYGANIIVCDNTYAHALGCARSVGAAFRHVTSGAKAIEDAIRIATEAAQYGGQFDNAALRLISTRMDDSDMRTLAGILIPGESTRAGNDRDKLMAAWTSSPGAAPGTAWGAAQAVTWWTSHEIGTRGDTDRAFALATGDGRGADVQATAWWHITTDEGQAALQTVKIRRV